MSGRLDVPVVQVHCTKVHKWRGKYARVFTLTARGVVHRDPATWAVTNEYSWVDGFVGCTALPDAGKLSLVVKKTARKNETMTFTCSNNETRAYLLAQVREMHAAAIGTPVRRLHGKKVTRSSDQQECFFEVAPSALRMLDATGRLLRQYAYLDTSGLARCTDEGSAFVMTVCGRDHVLLSPDREPLLQAIANEAAAMGKPLSVASASYETACETVVSRGTDEPEFAKFFVSKFGIGRDAPARRTLAITSGVVIERDVSTYGVSSMLLHHHIAALVRDWQEPQAFCIETVHGHCRRYLCTQRDALLSTLHSAVRLACPDRYVPINPEPRRMGLRLGPPVCNLDRDPQILELVLKQLLNAGKAAVVETGEGGAAGATEASAAGGGGAPFSMSVYRAAELLNANLNPRALMDGSLPPKSKRFKLLTEVLRAVATQVQRVATGRGAAPVPVTIALLQALVRLLRSRHCRATLLALPGISIEAIVVALLKSTDNNVVYWGIALLTTLCTPPNVAFGGAADAARAASPVPGGGPDGEPQLVSSAGAAYATTTQDSALLQRNVRALLGQSRNIRTALMSMLDRFGSPNSSGALIVAAVICLLESVLCSHSDATPESTRRDLLIMLANHYGPVLAQFRSSCPAVAEAVALLVRTIVTRLDKGTVSRVQDAALSRGVTLRHLHQGLFSPDADRRFVGRYLFGLWLSDHSDTYDMLRRVLPQGMMHYLHHPRLTKVQRAKLEAEDADRADDDAVLQLRLKLSAVRGLKLNTVVAGEVVAEASLDESSGPSGLDESRLVGKLVYCVVYPVDASGTEITRGKRRTAAARVRAQVGGCAFSDDAELLIGGNSDLRRASQIAIDVMCDDFKVPLGTLRLDVTSLPAQETQEWVALKSTGEIKITMQRQWIGVDADQVERRREVGATRLRRSLESAAQREEPEAKENAPVLFHMLLADHSRAELLWHRDARAELRAAIEAELRDIDREAEIGRRRFQKSEAGATKREQEESERIDAVASNSGIGGGRHGWNHSEFRVRYPSLEAELRIGKHYLRLLLEESQKTGTVDLHLPKPFFEALYNRMLRETDLEMKAMCLEAMCLLYTRYHKKLGAFLDTPYLVTLIATAEDYTIHDRLLLLLQALVLHVENAEMLLESESIEMLVDLVAMAHTQEFVSALSILQQHLKATEGTMMLTNAPSSTTEGPRRAVSARLPTPGAAPAETTTPTPDATATAKEKSNVREWRYVDASHAEVGPVCFDELKDAMDSGEINAETLVWGESLEDWTKLGEVRQLRWRLFMRDKKRVVLTPHTAAAVSLEILIKLLVLHPAVNMEGLVVHPIPRAKRILSSPRCLPHIVQAVLCGAAGVVDAVTRLLHHLLQHNEAVSRLYLTGIFFFLAGYAGSNFTGIAKLLAFTHLRQHFNGTDQLASELELHKRSILGVLLPESMLYILENYGGDKFAEAFLGDHSTPEVVWKHGMRRMLAEMIRQHLGGFAQRLADNTHCKYEYCPMPAVVYEELEEELWCDQYYLANLCEPQFEDWAVRDPIKLLQAVLKAWRVEMAKTETGLTVAQALTSLGLSTNGGEATPQKIRKAYRRLAIRYHPDKNPSQEAAERFNEITKAYDLLSAARRGSPGPDAINVLLIVKVQSMLFRRFPEDLKPYKYAGYPYLLSALRVEGGTSITPEHFVLLEAGTTLVFYTCLCSHLNATELLRESGGHVLAELLSRCVSIVSEYTERDDVVMKTTEHCLQVFAGLAALPNGRLACAALPGNPIGMVYDFVRCLRYQQAPLTMKYALEGAGRFCNESSLQHSFLDAGALWMLVPLLFRFDSTVDAEESDIDTNAQAAANMTAVKAANVLARLSGQHADFPENALCIRALGLLLTPSLAKLLNESGESVIELLKILSTSTTTPYRLWTAAMRDEVLQMMEAGVENARIENDWCAAPALDFRLEAQTHELVVGGVYIRIYNEKCEHVPAAVEAPQGFARALLGFIEIAVDRLVVATDEENEALWTYHTFAGDEAAARNSIKEAALARGDEVAPQVAASKRAGGKGDVQQVCACLVALKNLIESNPGVEEETASRHLPLLFQLLAPGALFEKPHPALRDAALAVITAMSRNAVCAAAIAEERLLAPLFRLLRTEIEVRKRVLRVVASLCETRAVVQEVMRVWGVLELMRILVGMGGSAGDGSSVADVDDVDEHGRNVLTSEATDDLVEERKAAALVLSRMLQERVVGPKMFIVVQRFLPLALARSLRETPDEGDYHFSLSHFPFIIFYGALPHL